MNCRKWDWWLLLELLLLPFLVIGVQDPSAGEKIAMTGQNVTLQHSKKPLGPYKRLTWLYTKNQKILEYENGEKEPKYFNTLFKNRVKLDLESGALHLYDVQKKDQGVYYMRLYNVMEEEWGITLKVLDPVPKPHITIEKKEESNGFCYLNLSCTIKNQTVDHTWYDDSGSLSQKNQGGVLELIITPQNFSSFYTCQVSNLVSSENDTVNFISPCTLAKSSGVTWIATWLVPLTSIILCSLLS